MKTPIVILHGWKVTGDRYRQLEKYLKKEGYIVFIPELPGFNGVPLLKDSMSLDDYVFFIEEFLKKKNITRVVLIGHSFGGRISTKFAYRHSAFVEKLILTGSPVINKKSIKKIIIKSVAKVGKKVFAIFPAEMQQIPRKLLYHSIGEWDYYKAGDLRETFISIINENLMPLLSQITVPTLVLWGEKDTFVPVSIAKEIVTRMPNAKLVVIKNASHKVPYEVPEVFGHSILSFLSS